jgi:tetratricopeptide (TPR) repeat protein
VAQRAYPVPRTYVALARFAPDKALAIAETEGDPRFAVYRHYARGEALLTKGDIAGALAEAKAIGAVKGVNGEPEPKLARWVIEGRVAEMTGQPKRAAQIFLKAAKLQEKTLKDSWDPPAWWYPVRRSAAAAYLKAGDFAKAEAEATGSLKTWKHDPLALWVLGKAEQGLGKAAEGAAHLEDARKIWRGDFDSITVEAI